MFGQPELDDNLNQTHIRQLRERITHSFHLGPLQTKDIGEYLIFRLRAAGYHGPHLFSEAAIKKLSKAAQGLVRRVNILADKALLAAFADNVFQVTPRHVSAAIQDSEFGAKAKPVKKSLLLGALILIMLGAVGLTATFINNKYKTPSVNDSQKKAESELLKKAATPNINATKVDANKVDVSPINADVAKAPVVLATQAATIEVEKAVDAKQQLADQRFNATNNLLLTAPPETVTLQIKSLASKPAIGAPEVGNLSLTDEPLNAELEKLSQQIETDNIYLYHTRKSGEIYTVILYGAFAQRAEALAALKGLPASIRNNHPYLRTFAGVKKDIEQE
jgi:septal ring-binding cell division protein DamX